MEFLSHIWDYIWFFFSIFVLISYLMVLFSIVSDLFRDRDLHGGWKALWFVFLIFVPVLTALVYLIARGRGMAERNRKQALTQQDAVEGYIREVAGAKAPASEIAQAKALLDAGTITQQEFEQIKSKALA